MNEKTVRMSSRKIENKITLVTSILGAIIVNIIWWAGIKEEKDNIQPSFTQNETDSEIKEVEIQAFPLAASLRQANLEY